ncbi:hypothetical protein ACROYT_G029614 [Oculina patagonica]
MEKLVNDLENAIWSKSGGKSAQSESSCGEEDAKQLSSRAPAVLGQTVCYIASAVVLHEGRVLMMKEAKKSCRGTWYLPAGRVEKNESLEEGVIREVLEETGLSFQPISIICVDSQGSSWFRFTFVGFITGGKLKTLEEQDKESMEAGWFATQEVFTSLLLRARDICPLINAAVKWYETKQENPICRLLPVKKAHSHIVVRLLVVNMGYGSNVNDVIHGLIRDFDSHIQYKTHGYINIEHSGKPHGVADGLCVTFLVEVFLPVEQGILKGKYHWFEVEEKSLADKIWGLIDANGCAEIMEY